MKLMSQHPLYNRGMSTVEVLVASAISLIMLAGILNIYLNSKTTYRFTESLEVIQDDARFIFDIFERQIHMAGYRSSPAVGSGQQFSEIDSIFTVGSPFITGTSGTGINNSDTITVRFQGSGDGVGNPDGSMYDCANNLIDANAMGTSTLAINNNLQLTCNGVALVNNIETFVVLYGEDVTGDNNANRYVPANYPGLSVNNIVSVRISFLLRSNRLINETNDTSVYNLIGTNYDPVDDKRLRKVFTKTIQMRNFDSSNNNV